MYGVYICMVCTGRLCVHTYVWCVHMYGVYVCMVCTYVWCVHMYGVYWEIVCSDSVCFVYHVQISPTEIYNLGAQSHVKVRVQGTQGVCVVRVCMRACMRARVCAIWL